MGVDLLVLPRRASSISQDILRARKGRRDDLFPQDNRPGGRIILPQGTREAPQSVRVHFPHQIGAFFERHFDVLY